MFYLANLTFI